MIVRFSPFEKKKSGTGTGSPGSDEERTYDGGSAHHFEKTDKISPPPLEEFNFNELFMERIIVYNISKSKQFEN